MAKFVILFVAALAFQAAFAVPKKNQQRVAGDDTVAARLEKLRQSVADVLEKVLPSQEDLNKKFVEGTKVLAEAMDNSVNTLKQNMDKHKGEVDDFVKTQVNNLSEAVNRLKGTVGEDTMKKFNEIKTQVDTQLKEFVNNMKELDTAVQKNLGPAADKAQHFIEDALKDMAHNAETFLHQVQESANKN